MLRTRRQAPKHRAMVFTLFADPTESEEAVLNRSQLFTSDNQLLLLDPTHATWTHVRYCVYQREISPTTGREHFQGYVEFTCPKTFSAAKSLDGLAGAHFEARRGSAVQADHYCRKPVPSCGCSICLSEKVQPTKVEGPWVYGTMTAQGSRTDLDALRVANINPAVPLAQIAQDFYGQYLRYSRGIKEVRRLSTPPRNFKSKVFLFVGPSGTGKTRTALLLAKSLGSVFVVPDKHSGFWCDDYDNQQVLFIDEFAGHRMTPSFFNGLCDRYEFVVPAHGNPGHQLVSRFIIICSNYYPSQWWKDRDADQIKQTVRRIDHVIDFNTHYPLVNLDATPCPCCHSQLKCPKHPDAPAVHPRSFTSTEGIKRSRIC